MVSQEQHAAAVEAAYREGHLDGAMGRTPLADKHWRLSDARHALSEQASVAIKQHVYDNSHNRDESTARRIEAFFDPQMVTIPRSVAQDVAKVVAWYESLAQYDLTTYVDTGQPPIMERLKQTFPLFPRSTPEEPTL